MRFYVIITLLQVYIFTFGNMIAEVVFCVKATIE